MEKRVGVISDCFCLHLFSWKLLYLFIYSFIFTLVLGLSLVLVEMEDKEQGHMIVCFVYTCVFEFRLIFSYLNIIIYINCNNLYQFGA